jgi:hypothetical protein
MNAAEKGSSAMGAARFAVIVTAVLLASFFGMKWLLTIQPLRPDARIPSFHHVDPDSAEYKFQQSSVSDDDTTRDHLRNEVINYAKALKDDPCNQVLRANYIKSVVAYARARISIAPCLGTLTCSNADSALLDRARKAFGTPFDTRVREAMQAAHARTVFGTGAFPRDTVRMIAEMAADPSINSDADTKEFRRISAQLGDTDTRPDCGD